ncbi:MAG: filamentous hemagglutinin N-terminal domain-containing protein, partial [Rhodospirillales bacterium]|nr:filamentous hemagglutinin N-terminal domain-containing protein [Rhodospirillales bacterium]
MPNLKRYCAAAAMLCVTESPAWAQIATDGTMGKAGVLTGPNYTIGADLGRQVGGNLFHSFGQFNVNTGQSASFTGPGSVSNIIGRVTGGSPSTIDGTLRSAIQGANLFLLNPSGVLFGPNARLDVTGSFHASTADHLKFADGATFSASAPNGSTLTLANPVAFG